MKAAVTKNYGNPSQLVSVELPTPELAATQILVEVAATAVTMGDVRLRSADFPGFTALPGRLMMGIRRPRNPVQGTTFAGRVIAIGSAVREFAVGDRVFGGVDHGAYAECVVVEEQGAIAPIPDDIDFDEAVATPYGAITALYFLQETANVQPGEHVLIVGAAGGVGQYAIQVAKRLGATVTAVCATEHIEYVHSLGADHVIDYRTTDALTGGPFDVIFDIPGVTTFNQARPALSQHGRFLTLMATLRGIWQTLWTGLWGSKRAFVGVALNSRARMLQLATWLADGRIKPCVGSSFEFDQLADAHEAAARRTVAGTVIVRLAPFVPPTAPRKIRTQARDRHHVTGIGVFGGGPDAVRRAL